VLHRHFPAVQETPDVESAFLPPNRAEVRFARPNIQIYDAHGVDLYQWVCARYLVGAKGAKTKAKRSQARLSTEFQSGSQLAFQTLFSSEATPGVNNRKTKI